jgi:hypothetical protein
MLFPLQKIFLICLLASELCFYLLIAQTGIVEYLNSDLTLLFTLPLGGILGSLFAYKSIGPFQSARHKSLLLLFSQFLLSFLYPHYNLLTLFVLGLCVGALAPLLLHLFSKKEIFLLTLSLILAYGIGTCLFTTDPSSRKMLAISFTLLSLSSLLFLKNRDSGGEQLFCANAVFASPQWKQHFSVFFLLGLWVAIDSSLFEILSRSTSMSIWRSSLWPVIVFFHTAGLAAAYALRNRIHIHHSLVTLLFAATLASFFRGNATALAVLYPFSISYYNFLLLRTLVRIGDLRTLGIAMLLVGWLPSGGGLCVAILDAPLVPVMLLIIAGCASFSMERGQFYKR